MGNIIAVGTIEGTQLKSTIAGTLTTGSAPFVVTSTKKVDNLNADLLDDLNSTDFSRHFGTKANTATTTAAFITLINSWGMFDYPHSTCKFTWDYSGNADITDIATSGSIELAGATLDIISDGSTRTMRLVCPNAGGGAYREFIYNDQGPTYSPG